MNIQELVNKTLRGIDGYIMMTKRTLVVKNQSPIAYNSAGIIPDNILAAGAIDYVYELGDELGIFDLLDAIIHKWLNGNLDINNKSAVLKLAHYWKRRHERCSKQERKKITLQVLNKGIYKSAYKSTADKHEACGNNEFTRLWQQLMNEVVIYIDRTSHSTASTFSTTNSISRAGIFQATTALQYNLSAACDKRLHTSIREILGQLEDAIHILRTPEILRHLPGAGYKNFWSKMQILARTELHRNPDIFSYRALALDGRKIYRWIATFDEQEIDPLHFITFVLAAESYILHYPRFRN